MKTILPKPVIILTLVTSVFWGLSLTTKGNAQQQVGRVLDVSQKPIDINSAFGPCGWMGDGEEGTRYITFNSSHPDNSRPGDNDNTTTKITYKAGPKNWAGIYWLYPASDNHSCNWGQRPATRVVNAQKISFWIKGETGGERVEIKMGDVRSRIHRDTYDFSFGTLELTSDWQRMEVDVSNANLEVVVGAFAWIAANPGDSGITFYLDGIQYE